MLSAFVDRVFASLRHRLRLVDPHEVKQAREEIRELRSTAVFEIKKLREDLNAVRERLDRTLGEMQEGVRRIEKGGVRAEKQTARIAEHMAALGARSETIQLYLRRLERMIKEPAGSTTSQPIVATPPASFPPPDRDWRVLHSCSICEHEPATLVCEYNRFLLNDRSPEAGFEVYNYSLCHACGTVYATRRPTGERYRRLFTNFSESLDRPPSDNPLLNPRPLTPEARVELQRRAERGALVSEHAGLEQSDWLSSLLSDRLASARHVEVLGSLLSLDRPRVLEIRSKTGAILDSLRRLYGADVSALSIFESQQCVLQTAYGIQTDSLIDFEKFEIPYRGEFDLIVSNHMLTHAIQPRRFLAVIRDRLRPSAHLYLYHEPDDVEFTEGGQSMFNVLNPFHLQTFDRPALVRALAANGFATKFVGHTDVYFFALAQKVDNVPFIRMSEEECQARIHAYRRARDVAILRLPQERRHLFASEWETVLERAVVSGLADITDRGRITITAKTHRRTTVKEPAYH